MLVYNSEKRMGGFMSFIKKMIEKFNQKVVNRVKQMSTKTKHRVAAGALGLTMIGTIIACANNPAINQTDNGLDDIVPGIVQTGDIGNKNESNKDTILSTEVNTSKPPIQEGLYSQYEHSDVYYSAENRWDGLWGSDPKGGDRESFLYSAAPFASLYDAGVIYYNQDDEPRVYDVDDEFTNSQAIQTRMFIDEKTANNDVYLVTQIVNGATSPMHSNGDIAVYSIMLKYDNLPTDLYMDILLYAGDCDLNLIIQEMDEWIAQGRLKGDDGNNATCQVLSESIINYDLIGRLGVFKTTNGKHQSSIEEAKKHVNFIENIDYEKGLITVNYADIDNPGHIYSYTYDVKETPGWEGCLIYNIANGSITKEYRDSLTMQDIMTTYEVPAGEALDGCHAGMTLLRPSDEQKATAKLKYELTQVANLGLTHSDKVNLYENGKLKYDEVNALTRSFINNLKSGITK